MDNAGAMPIMIAFGIGIAFVVLSLTLAKPPSNSDLAREVEYIDVTIAGLKNTYKTDEPIIFSVKVEGISDSQDIACNNYPPEVAIQDDSNGEQEVLNPLRFSTALLCAELPAPFEVEFTFGEKERIEIDNAGSYTVLVSYDDLMSYEDIVVEKQFVVSS